MADINLEIFKTSGLHSAGLSCDSGHELEI
jgi:hypothetical protein